MRQAILVVAAHPDDEVLGCGGTIARYVQEEKDVHVLILGEGMTSRDKDRKKDGLERLKKDAHKANLTLGAKEVFLYDFPDNRFDTVALLDIVKVIEKIKRDIKPGIIYTHHRNDLNIDHRITCDAVLTAARPLKGETVREIYSFEVPSSTEWSYSYQFRPNIFKDITGTVETKIEALKRYGTEIREFPHPRSEQAVRAAAKRWGSVSGLGAAEAFEAVRIIR